jgi:tRNA nucleotidyltransferase/poly(A) polymerase
MGLLALAEIISKYGPQIPHELWERKLAAMFALLYGYFDRYDQLIQPKDIINGNDLIQEFGYKPGQEIGAILQQITEAQAAGEVRDRDAALAMARKLHTSTDT